MMIKKFVDCTPCRYWTFSVASYGITDSVFYHDVNPEIIDTLGFKLCFPTTIRSLDSEEQ